VSPSITGLAALSGTLTRQAGEDAGQYDVLQGTLTDANNPNYTITFVSKKFTIGRAAQATITITTVSKTYGTNLTLAISGGSGDGAVSYSLSANGAGCSITGGVLTSTGNAGTTCSVTATKAQSLNYLEGSSSATVVTVARRDISITPEQVLQQLRPRAHLRGHLR
jgi:hypothetical protein